MVDVTRDINTENEVENASCVDLQVWMGFFSDILKFKNDMFCRKNGKKRRLL